MNYDFLQSYNIPRNTENQYVSSNYSTMEGAYGTYSMQSSESAPAVNAAYYGYGGSNTYDNGYQSASAGNSSEYYNNPDRFLPPAQQGVGYNPYRTPFKRKTNAVGGGSAAKKETPIPELTIDGKLAMFLGRDESYPYELNSIIHPMSCDLCNTKMTSRAIAKDHYESKAHDKHISAWLFKNYTEKGVNPPEVKRFIRQGTTGPDAYYCEACDLKLTSLTHASQHYAGKKHQLVISQRAKPSGAGFYNSEGKWVRTGTKLTPNKCAYNRFGIGESFKLTEILSTTGNLNNVEKKASTVGRTISSAADTTTTSESEVKPSNVKNENKTAITKNSDQDKALFCSTCKISVTSAAQMTMHLSGSKHIKKLKSSGVNPTSSSNNTELQSNIVPPAAIKDNVLFSAIKEEIKPDPSDLSMYRTPSGQYYCKICNTSMSHLAGLEQHLKGKRHLKRQTEEKAVTTLVVKQKLK